MSSWLIKIFGFYATLIYGDPLVVDRWMWLTRRLPKTGSGESLLDVGCGTGAFTIGAALKGYKSLGLSWDVRNQTIAQERARLCGATEAKFEIFDVRRLEDRNDLINQFEIAICLENIEHILDDRKLLLSISKCLKPGGRLLLTTPFLLYKPITIEDIGPFSRVEDGWHVRRGYSILMLKELCDQAGLLVEEESYCSGYFSQKLCRVYRSLSRLSIYAGWAAILPFRLIPLFFDNLIFKLFKWPFYSICIVAYKPRF